MRKFLILCSVWFASPALAGNWAVDSAASTLTFQGKQSDESFVGGFKTFTVDADFTEAAPEKGRIHVSVDMASATIDGKDRAEALPTADWFDVKQFATAEFTSRSIKKTGEHAYAAVGDLSVHGVKKEVRIPFTLKPTGKMTDIDGSFELKRNDYGIGKGRWADDQWIAFPVTVAFHLVATAK